MIRPSYPDELPRIQSILAGSPVPGNARFSGSVKDQPVERILVGRGSKPVLPKPSPP